MERKKIVIVNDYMSGGGVEKVLYNLACYLSSKNYDITIMTFWGNEEEFYTLFPTSIKFVSCSIFTKRYKKWSLKWAMHKGFCVLYKYYLRCKRFDIAIAIKEGDCAKFVEWFRAADKFMWVHTDYRLLYWTKYVFKTADRELSCMRRYKNVICVSDAAKQSVCEVIGNPGNLLVRYNPLDVEHIIKSAEEVSDELKKRELDKTILVSVGRLCEQKGYLRLLECCARLNEYYDYELWIVGEGTQREELEAYITQHNMKNVVLWGEQNNPYPFIKKANWYVSSSFGESYGLTVQEALVLGVPVLATTCPAFEECVSDKGAIFVENSLEGLYLGLKEILENNELQTKYKRGICQAKTQEALYMQRMEAIEKLWL